MAELFNKLSPEVHELLVKLNEECAEVCQAVSKILLHGIRNNPYTGKLNRENLEAELTDVLVFIDLLERAGVLSMERIVAGKPRKLERLGRPDILHHSTLVTKVNCTTCGMHTRVHISDTNGNSICKDRDACLEDLLKRLSDEKENG